MLGRFLVHDNIEERRSDGGPDSPRRVDGAERFVGTVFLVLVHLVVRLLT